MPQTLTLLHTAPGIVEGFDAVVHELAPELPVRHVIMPELLDAAREKGDDSDDARRQVHDAVLNEFRDGAEVLLCTCSTLGALAESAPSDKPTLRVDRPMAERAVSIGERIIVAATLLSTFGPTLALLKDAAEHAGTSPELIEVHCETAWEKFEADDSDGYFEEIAKALRSVASNADVIVLAQASMAPAADLCDDIDIPILSSPRLGVQAAIDAYRSAVSLT